MRRGRKRGLRQGRWALVTGASGGLGEGFVRVLAEEGWNVVLAGRREDRLAELGDAVAREWGVEVRIVPGDLALPDGVAGLVARLEEMGIRVDLLVNNAGVGVHGPFVEADPEALLRTIQLNAVALTELTHRLLPPMLARGRGWVLNVASTAAFQPGPRMAVYYATKAYVLSFSEALRVEVAGKGIRVTALCPGSTATRFQFRAGIRGSALGRRFPGADPVRIARYGVRAVLRGRAIAVPGILNRAQIAALRFLPRSLASRLMGWIQALR